MKKKIIIKIGLDFIMAILFILMFNKRVLGMSFHEIGGLVVCVMFIAHQLLNWKWIVTVTKKITSKDLPSIVKINYLLDILLLIVMCAIALSGIFISKILFPNFTIQGSTWKIIHISVAGIGLALVGIHLGLHWRFIISILGKRFKNTFSIPLRKGVCGVTVIVCIVIGSYSIVTSNFTRWLMMPFTTSQMRGERTSLTDRDQSITEERHFTQNGQSKSGERGQSELKRKEKNQRKESVDGEQNKHEGKKSNESMDISIGTLLQTLITFMSIMSLFTITTYYIEKIIRKTKLKSKN
ncbi:hypothetical protein CS063_12710 [Sporanaerobium hydrogeniformans]|uniref:Uncharacterized protein n=1 Tax=Sporanaerobium hydrogeniformans TaxID=3072179 RepID=A0AC61DB99_9FIRM|nr:DUF4405 domain-containing protein [Sporanaerobium hydrogeniformans]PHV70001.1 hypothetical protein CS063_12710 [Sporanaerobium hydrogeniformans]